MNARLPRFARLRAGLFGTLGLALLASACETPLPTTAELERMDVTGLESRTIDLQGTAVGGEPTYFVDGKQVTPEEARALTADRIVRMEVTRTAGSPGTVNIYTTPRTEGDAVRHSVSGTAERVMVRTRQGGTVNVTTTEESGGERRVQFSTAGDGFDGLLVIDGVITDASALRSIDPNGIDRVEVIKGAAATTVYSDPRAANGVIRITTKGAANP